MGPAYKIWTSFLAARVVRLFEVTLCRLVMMMTLCCADLEQFDYHLT